MIAIRRFVSISLFCSGLVIQNIRYRGQSKKCWRRCSALMQQQAIFHNYGIHKYYYFIVFIGKVIPVLSVIITTGVYHSTVNS